MADFSFSFDSDNPFAEPEQPPKKANAPTNEAAADPAAATAGDAAPTPAADAPVDVAPASSAPDSSAPGDDEFSLDSFDFAFDEDDSINDTLPTRNAPLGEAPPRQLTPGEAAFAEFDFNAPDEGEAPAAETPEVETPEVEAPEREMPDFEAPQAEAPEVEAPVAEVAELEMPDFEAPATEAPIAEVVETEAPVAEAPATEAPVAEMSEFEAPEGEITQEMELSAKDSGRPARSDLEEFNAFTYDFGLPDDEMFGGETDAQTLAGAATIEASDETFAEVAPPEVSDAEMPVAEAPVAEAPVAEAPVAEMSDAEMPVGEMSVAELSMNEFPVAESVAEETEVASETDAPDFLDAVPSATAAEDAEAEGQTEGEFRRLKTRTTLKVAVLGASGIGKNHARWFHRHGCQVVGFLGTSPDSTTQTETDLSADFDFQGNPYTDLEVLLQTETPDIVCVATPPPLHFSHVLQSLEAGAHVLCEKPLVYAPTRKFRENRDGAKELVKVAARRKLNLGTQLQYGGATPILCKLAGLTPSDVGDFAMELETTNPNSPRDPRELWIDLGPHPISVAQMLAGTGSQLAEETIVFEPFQDDEKTEVLARFGINCADGRLLMVRAVVRALRGENLRKPRRRFSFNGHAVTYAPLQSVKNGFQAQFVAPDGYASVYPDPVDYLIGNFVAACRNGEAPMISGDFGRENLEWMLKVGMPAEAR